MTLDYSIKGKLKIDMRTYIKEMTESFPTELSDKVNCPWTTKLFDQEENSRLLEKERNELNSYICDEMRVFGKKRQT